MNVIQLIPRKEQKESLIKRSNYQAKGYARLDSLTHENWAHRWRWIEISRRCSMGFISVWQFEFKTNNLEFSHYHKARPVPRDGVCSTRLWRGMEVVEQFPEGYRGHCDIDVPAPSIPEDVLAEARVLYLKQFEKNLEIIIPQECA